MFAKTLWWWSGGKKTLRSLVNVYLRSGPVYSFLFPFSLPPGGSLALLGFMGAEGKSTQEGGEGPCLSPPLHLLTEHGILAAQPRDRLVRHTLVQREVHLH